jgi:hypothetical protein
MTTITRSLTSRRVSRPVMVLAAALVAGAALAAGSATAATAATARLAQSPSSMCPGANVPAFGPNVCVFTDAMSQATIQADLNNIASQQVPNQFGTQRYAILFAPGTYGSATVLTTPAAGSSPTPSSLAKPSPTVPSSNG